ncbi:MAG: amidohydrolase [Gammaproteobacteria bacterium]|nr:amidohydrolase [Gammaproteobacteria bacterium]
MNSTENRPLWNEIIHQATTFRRTLHQHPELSWEERETADRIRTALSAAAIDWRPCATTGTVATITATGGAPHIALRADIDALPLQESGQQAWCSRNRQVMHACGHDGHTATLLATALWLKQHQDQLPGTVTFLFQPAEEGGHGAEKMIADGALNGVERIFGWHNWPALPFGKAVAPAGAIMAANGSFEITLTGRGGHSSQPEACRDPILAASATVLALQQIVARRLPPQQAAVVSVTSIDGISNATIIPEKVKMRGSLRVISGHLRSEVEQLITTIVHATASSYGVEAEVSHQPHYEATVNHPAAAEQLAEALSREFGPSWQGEIPLPIMGSEDFSAYLQQIPGAFALIGSDDGEEHAYPCHSSHYDFNDRLIAPAVRILSQLAGVQCH